MEFYNSATNGNRKECSIKELQNLQLHPQTMSLHYLVKLERHIQHILKSIVPVFHHSTEERVCVWDKWAVFFIKYVQNVRLVRKFQCCIFYLIFQQILQPNGANISREIPAVNWYPYYVMTRAAPITGRLSAPNNRPITDCLFQDASSFTERYLKLNSIHSFTLSSLLCSVECWRWYVTDYWVISYLTGICS